MLDGKIVDPEDRSLFETALNCSKLMMYLVKDFLDFSQLEAQSFILNITEFDVFQLLKEVISIFRF
jgi:signal transduction histidine kinase